MKKWQFTVVFIVMAAVLYGGNVYAKEGQDGLPPDTEMDMALDDFLKRNLNDDSVYVESHMMEEYKQVNAFTHKERDWSEGMTGKIYTYVSEKEGLVKYQTVWDLHSTKKIRVGKGDFISLEIPYCLWCYDPIECELWTKNNMDDEWKYKKKATANFSSFVSLFVFASEIRTRDDYVRILLTFTSDENPEQKGVIPVYKSTYINVTGEWIYPTIKAVFYIVIISLLIWIFFKYRRKSE